MQSKADLTCLVIEADELLRDFLQEYLTRNGARTTVTQDIEEGAVAARLSSFDLVLVEETPGGESPAILRKLMHACPDSRVVVIASIGSLESSVHAFRNGAYDYLTKPIGSEELRRLLARVRSESSAAAAAPKQSEKAPAVPAGKAAQGKGNGSHGPASGSASGSAAGSASGDEAESIIGSSAVIHEVRQLVRIAARSDATVLISGETGTGKELVSRAIHNQSERHDDPFLSLNCAALPESLFESELFGHEKGAFTGAIQARKGRFERAGSGTILLDEISEVSLGLQSKLLRVLQEREFERIGSTTTERLNARVLATTNRDLAVEIKNERFRSDLYYRLSVFPIHLPPLRERGQDILELAAHFLAQFADRNESAAPRTLSEAAQAKLLAYSWPGNVRQLHNCLERACLLATSERILAQDLAIAGADPVSEDAGTGILENPKSVLEKMEEELLLRAIQECGGNRTEAARRLGITTRTLRNKLHRMGKMGFMKGEDVSGKPVPSSFTPLDSETFARSLTT
ncbi:MAG: sigma-54-dependent Fis family transcriptional regulator [Gemmatimonadetes bacterium]|nr:sigma-54-dependent Fis family transcriptional regulator [Gemmatimonadota bacterium]